MLRRARILGSGGWIPTAERETSCLLVLADDGAIVVDAGSGLRRLVLEPAVLEGRTQVDLVLTHFHLDHTAALVYLPALGPGVEVRIWGPGAALYGRPTEEILEPLFSPPLSPIPRDACAREIRDLPVGALELAGVPIVTSPQLFHSHPSMGLRLGDRLAWCTDTPRDPATIALAQGVEVLCHEAWGHGEDPDEPTSHTSAAQAAAVATEAGAARLVLIHVPPLGDHDAMLAEARAGHPDVTVATDLLDLLP